MPQETNKRPKPSWTSPAGKNYLEHTCPNCKGRELVCPICGSCSWCGEHCSVCEDDFTLYLRTYYEAFGAAEEDIVNALKKWKKRL